MISVYFTLTPICGIHIWITKQFILWITFTNKHLMYILLQMISSKKLNRFQESDFLTHYESLTQTIDMFYTILHQA